jgi:hypothetical protein
VNDIGPWKLVDKSWRFPYLANQGLATVAGQDGKHNLCFRGDWSLPLEVRVAGIWDHIGDPDSRQGVIIDCYQAKLAKSGKMFRSTKPDKTTQDYIHPLTTGEMLNNSFAAISPDGQWMLSGEWDTVKRFLIFPTPVLNPAATVNPFPLTATLELDHPVCNIQGATFVDPLTILCSSDDPGTTLWPVPRQLLQVDLERPLDGHQMSGHVTCVGAIPVDSTCSGTFEVEGIDYDITAGDLRVLVIPPSPCGEVSVTLYHFRRDP